MSCVSPVKYLLYIFNLAFCLLGLAVLGVGVYTHISGKSLGAIFNGGEITVPSILLMAIGGAVFIIAFFGCCGAIREDPCCLTCYGILLTVLLLAQIAIGVLCFVFRGYLVDEFDKLVEESFSRAVKQEKEALIEIGELQKNMECCGLDGPDYWIRNFREVPQSCCKNAQLCSASSAFQDGCRDKAVATLRHFMKIIGIPVIVVGVVELVGVIFAFCLASSIRRRELRGYA